MTDLPFRPVPSTGEAQILIGGRQQHVPKFVDFTSQKSAQTPRRRDLIEKQVQIRAAQIAINKDDLISQKGQTQARCAVSVDLPVPPLPPATGQITVDGAGVSRTMAFESSATGSGRRGAGRGRSWTVMGLASVDDLQHCIREERRAGRQVCKNKGL